MERERLRDDVKYEVKISLRLEANVLLQEQVIIVRRTQINSTS